jgi:hypothetical protein
MTTPNRPTKLGSGSQSKSGSLSNQSSILGFFQRKSEAKPASKPDFKDGSKHLKTPVPSSDPVEPTSSPLVTKSSVTSFGMGKENGVLVESFKMLLIKLETSDPEDTAPLRKVRLFNVDT